MRSFLVLGLCALGLLLPALEGCTAKIRARDPQAVRAHDALAESARTPFAFPPPEDAPGGTPQPGATQTPPSTSPGSGDVEGEATSAPTVTTSPTATATPTATGTPRTATVTGLTLPEPKTYRIGDELVVKVTFDAEVEWTGVPTLEFKEGAKVFAFEPFLGLGGAVHSYRHVVRPGETSSALTLEPKFNLTAGTLQERNGGEVVPSLPATPLTGIALDGDQDKAVKVILPESGTYTDAFDVVVEFPGNVPRLEVVLELYGRRRHRALLGRSL